MNFGKHYRDQRKINPSGLQRRCRPDGSPECNDRTEIGPTAAAFTRWHEAGLAIPDLNEIRRYRLDRILAEMHQRELGGVLLFDPLNIRYATDSTNMQLWITHNASRAAFVGSDGTMVLYDYGGCEHLSAHLPLIREIRPMMPFFYFEAGDDCEQQAAALAADVRSLVDSHGDGHRTLAVDRSNQHGFTALEKEGLTLSSGEALMEHARKIKSAEERKAIQCAVNACEYGLDQMRAALVPGISENELWAELHHANIALGGEWIETRLLSSGPRTNPWMQECGPRIIAEGDLVVFDTDLVGCYGYCVDMSRAWLCGADQNAALRPTAEQKQLYQIAWDHIMSNTEIIKPGMSFRELTLAGKPLPEKYRALQYGVMFHGVGLCDEYPAIRYAERIDQTYPGNIEQGMVMCVEAYVGEINGHEGVKLENQLWIGDKGAEVMTNYPFESLFLD